MDDPTGGSRAGAYVTQQTGYRAFIPAPLPPQPELHIDHKTYTLLSAADRALGRLDGACESVPNADLFVLMYVRKEAALSAQIEGTQASLNDLLAAEADVLEAERPGDLWEISNYVTAMNYGLKRVHELPVSSRLLREIHERLMRGTRGDHLTPGEFRTSQNWLGDAGSTLRTAGFVPPPPDQVAESMSQLERFAHGDSQIPPLIKVGLIHAQFETIHPFLDGNGRLGRLLITLLLAEKDILRRPLLYLSNYLKAHRAEYYERLQAIRDEGDWEGWIKFFLTGVAAVSNDAVEVLRAIVTMREQHRGMIMSELGRSSRTGLAILEALYRTPYLTVGGAARIAGVSFANANRIVGELERMGLLEEMTGRARNRVYRYRAYLDALST